MNDFSMESLYDIGLGFSPREKNYVSSGEKWDGDSDALAFETASAESFVDALETYGKLINLNSTQQIKTAYRISANYGRCNRGIESFCNSMIRSAESDSAAVSDSKKDSANDGKAANNNEKKVGFFAKIAQALSNFFKKIWEFIKSVAAKIANFWRNLFKKEDAAPAQSDDDDSSINHETEWGEIDKKNRKKYIDLFGKRMETIKKDVDGELNSAINQFNTIWDKKMVLKKDNIDMTTGKELGNLMKSILKLLQSVVTGGMKISSFFGKLVIDKTVKFDYDSMNKAINNQVHYFELSKGIKTGVHGMIHSIENLSDETTAFDKAATGKDGKKLDNDYKHEMGKIFNDGMKTLKSVVIDNFYRKIFNEDPKIKEDASNKEAALIKAMSKAIDKMAESIKVGNSSTTGATNDQFATVKEDKKKKEKQTKTTSLSIGLINATAEAKKAFYFILGIDLAEGIKCAERVKKVSQTSSSKKSKSESQDKAEDLSHNIMNSAKRDEESRKKQREWADKVTKEQKKKEEQAKLSRSMFGM